MRFIPLLLLLTACRMGPSSPAADAASRHDFAAIQAMLANGLDLNQHDGTGYTPLIAAARAGDAEMLRFLVERGADPNLSDQAVSGWSPLLHAVHVHQLGSVAALIDAGADPNRLSGDGITPLMMAAGYGHTDMVQLLLRRGANPRIADRHGATAFDLALSGVPDIDRFTLFDCQSETVKVLQSADPTLRGHVGLATPAARTWARLKGC